MVKVILNYNLLIIIYYNKTKAQKISREVLNIIKKI